HARLLPGIMDLTVPGCFAMTEIGHGSDVAALGTTATYHPQTEEFVIDTPVTAARKEYIGNAGQHGIAAVVFAQLISHGVNHGVHAFYVPIRERAEDGTLRFVDRKSTRLNSSHVKISYAGFCLKKKTTRVR